jgi:hypothetical protein
MCCASANGLNREVQGARGARWVFQRGRHRGPDPLHHRHRGAALRRGPAAPHPAEALIASRPGNLEQLLEIERELARVGGEIVAAESTWRCDARACVHVDRDG